MDPVRQFLNSRYNKVVEFMDKRPDAVHLYINPENATNGSGKSYQKSVPSFQSSFKQATAASVAANKHRPRQQNKQ